MQIVPGFYHLSQIRHLALTKDHSNNFMFMVTLRDNQAPAIFPEVDQTHWLWVDQNSMATVWFSELPVIHGLEFIREFEKMYLLQEPAQIVPHLFEVLEIMPMDKFEKIMCSDELKPATDRLRKQPSYMMIPPGRSSIVEIVQATVLEYIADIRLKRPVFVQIANPVGSTMTIVIVNLKCRVFYEVEDQKVAQHVYDLTAYVAGMTPEIMMATRGGPYRSPSPQEMQANMLPRFVSLDGTKIRNASFSGSRLSSDGFNLYHRAGDSSEFDAKREIRRMVGFGEHVPVGTILDGEQHSPTVFNGMDFVERLRHTSGYARLDDTNLFSKPINSPYLDFYKTTPSQPIKSDGPEPEPVVIPWLEAVAVFRPHLIGLLMEKHGMTYIEASEFVDHHQAREDDNNLLRKAFAEVKPSQPRNTW